MKFTILLFFQFIYVLSNGQSHEYSLLTLLQKVKNTYPTIKAKQSLIRSAGYQVRAARKDFLPDLVVADQYQFSTSNGLEGSYYSNGGTAISTSGSLHSTNIYQGVFGSFTTFMVNWHVFDFGKVKQNVRLAEARVDLAKADYENEVFQQQVKVTDAYLLLMLSMKLVSVQKANLQRSLSFEQYVLSHTLSGLLPGIDSSSANAEVAKAQIALLQSQQTVAQQKNILEELSGVPVDSIEVDTSIFLRTIPSNPNFDSSVLNNPSIIYSVNELQTQIQQAEVIHKSALPTINVLGIGWARGSGIDRSTKEYNSNLSEGIPYQSYNYMGGIAFNWNILSLGKAKQQYNAARQEVEATQLNIDEQKSTLQKELQNAQLQYGLALTATKLAPVQYKAALDAYNLANARYEAGLSSLSDVIQAYYVLNRADVDSAVSVNNVWRALLQHTAASGNLSEFTNRLPR